MPRIAITDQYALVKRKGSENWYLEWRERGEKLRRSCGTTGIDEAKVKARSIILESARIVDAQPTAMPVSVVIDRYLVKHGNKIASASSARAAAKLWNEFFAHDTVADLQPDRFDDFLSWLREREWILERKPAADVAPTVKRYSASYIRRVMMLGKAALNRAWRRQEITSVPFVPLPAGGEAYPHVAKRDELVRFLNCIPTDSNVWAYTMIRLCTACRGDAALELQPFQVDFDLNLVRLNPPGRAQTKKYRPVVPLTAALGAVLRAAKADPYYVASQRGDTRLGSIRKAWRAVRIAAKLPPYFVPKICRHTVASELRRRGVPGWEVSGLLGHSKGDAASTTAVYAKYDPNYLGAARQTLDAWLAELALDVPRLQALIGVSAGSVGLETTTAQSFAGRAVVGLQVVGSTGIEPVTPTMSTQGNSSKVRSIRDKPACIATTENQTVSEDAGSVRGQHK